MPHDEELEDAMAMEEDEDEDGEEEDEEEQEVVLGTTASAFRGPAEARQKNLDTIRAFLGGGKQTRVAVVLPRYYGGLLAWALQRHIEAAGWKVVKALGRFGPTPGYTDVYTDCDQYENLLCGGSCLLAKETVRIAATITAHDPNQPAQLVVASTRKAEARKFARGVRKLARGPKLYGGKNIELGGRIRFLTVPSRSWEDLIVAPALKKEIEANTVGFLNRREELAGYGVPPRRGLILVGEPGTGKTLVSKILMNRSPGITCIKAHENGLGHSGYIHELYELADDLKPSIVFIEDIDLIGEKKRGEALFALLSALDGVEDCRDIVTIATTNFIDIIDRALSERPSRFDRVIHLPLPSLEQRSELIRCLARQIPMDEDIQDYLARRTGQCTPAQVQEAAYSLVIDCGDGPDRTEPPGHEFTRADVDSVLARMKRRNRELGFNRLGSNGNGSGLGAATRSGVRGQTVGGRKQSSPASNQGNE